MNKWLKNNLDALHFHYNALLVHLDVLITISATLKDEHKWEGWFSVKIFLEVGIIPRFEK